MGKVCVGCGFCCCKAVCVVGIAHGAGARVDTPCTFLSYGDGRHWCSLVTDHTVPGNAIHADTGCSSALFNDWRKKPIVNRVA